MRQTPPPTDPVRIGELELDRTGYADDVDLYGETFLQRDLHVFNFKTNGRRIGLDINEKKTKAMEVSRLGRDVDFADIGGLMVEVVDHFKYLGSTISHDNTLEYEINQRVTSGNKSYWSLKSIFRSKNVTHRTKIQLYVTIIRPIVTYACEAWVLTKALERKIEVFENSILRRIYGPIFDPEEQAWRQRHNRELRELSRLPSIVG